MCYILTREKLGWCASYLFGWIAEGVLNFRVGGIFALPEAAGALRLLEGYLTTDKLLLIP